MKYEIENNNHTGWVNKFPWYNIYICSKLHGTVFKFFIRNARTDRFSLMCSINAHDKQQPTYVDGTSSVCGIEIPNNSTTLEYESLGVTLNFIHCQLKLFHQNYEVRSKMNNESMKELFKQIPTMKSKPLSHNEKHQMLLTYIGGEWYMEK